MVARSPLLIIVLLSFINCQNNQENNTNSLDSALFCDNELKLLNSFDTIQTLTSDFLTIKDSLEHKLPKLFKGDNCCKKLRFNVIHFVDSAETIKVSLNHDAHCDNCPIYCGRNYCIILLNSQGQVYIENQPVKINSLNNEIFNYYAEVGKSEYLPETYDRVNMSIQWDLNVSKDSFSRFINQIISGYLKFVNEFSKSKFKKETCQLNQTELSEIAKLIPLNIELPTLNIIEPGDIYPDVEILEVIDGSSLKLRCKNDKKESISFKR